MFNVTFPDVGTIILPVFAMCVFIMAMGCALMFGHVVNRWDRAQRVMAQRVNPETVIIKRRTSPRTFNATLKADSVRWSGSNVVPLSIAGAAIRGMSTSSEIERCIHIMARKARVAKRMMEDGRVQ